MAESNSSENELLAKRKGTSGIWNYFGFKTDDVHQTQVLCKTCRTPVATTRGNTTNLRHHLQHNHQDVFKEFMSTFASQTSAGKKSSAAQQTSVFQSFASGTPYDKTSKRHKEITEAISMFLAKDMMPINLVSRRGFLNMINKLDRRYDVPSRNYFSQVAIPQLYEGCRMTVEEELSHVGFFASTTDLWSSRTTEPYLSFTVHFLTMDFELKTRCLETVYFPDSHTSENIAQGLLDVIASWKLGEERQVCITTDNGPNVVRATELNKWVRLQCFGHRLHLAIESSIKDDARITRVIGLCKKLVGHFCHSWKAKMALKKSQKDHNLPEHTLLTECPTRWGSRQKMVERVLEQQRAISDVLSADKKSRHLIPTWQDLDVLESLNQALHPLQDFTDALSGESYVSVSYVKPVLHLMKTSVLAEKDTDSDLTKSIKKKILNYLISKYDNPATQELLDITSFLDPRFKATYINTDQVASIKTRVLSEMEANAQKERRSQETVPETRTNDPSSDPPKKAKKSLGSLFKTTSPPSASVTHLSQAVEAELSSYMLSATLDSEEDPLAWWKLHHITFPQLSKLARKYLCIPASSSPSERLFSTSGNIVTCQHTCLKPSKVNMLVFLAKNLA